MGFKISGWHAVNFTENAANVVLSDVEEPVRISYTVDNNPIMDEVEMHPDANKQIRLLTQQLIRLIRPLAGPDECFRELPRVMWTATKSDESVTLGGWLVPGGIAKSITSETELIDFFARNFLTHQPQIIETTPNQPQWLAFVRPYAYTKMEIYSTLYAADGSKFTKRILETPQTPYSFNQVDTSYTTLWKEFCDNNNLEPIAYDVFGDSLKKESTNVGEAFTSKPKHPIDQRYILRQPRFGEQYFGFVNGMGGFDTIVMTGESILEPDGEVETFTNSQVEEELVNDYTSHWEVSTGYLDSERVASQYQDFLKSQFRYCFHDGVWLRIIIDEYELKHTRGELNAYSFKYHHSEHNERRFYERDTLPDVSLPTKFFDI